DFAVGRKNEEAPKNPFNWKQKRDQDSRPKTATVHRQPVNRRRPATVRPEAESSRRRLKLLSEPQPHNDSSLGWAEEQMGESPLPRSLVFLGVPEPKERPIHSFRLVIG
ncbi:MAG: hypothetical protein LAQ69_33485, partial [Acidobacteriia bacterium]|nr:hypothetical protein [Terriglobia bacterium]